MMHPSFITAGTWRRRDVLEAAARERLAPPEWSQAARAPAEPPPFAKEAPAHRVLAWLRGRRLVAAAPAGRAG